MTSAIEFAALGKRYREIVALVDITAGVPAGQVVGLLGHNGAGKSTLIKLVLGLTRASSGALTVLGATPWGKQAAILRRRIGYLPENVSFYPNLTGSEVLGYLARLKQAPAGEVQELLARVGLAAAGQRRVGGYSRGMRQRLGLAQALLGAPELVVLDEPTSGLDPQATQEFFGIVAELRRAGRSVVISSHLLAELEPHLDAAMILGHGRLLAAGSIAELRRRSGLPDIVRVRVRTEVAPRGFVREMQALGRRCEIRDDGQVEFSAVNGEKRRLLGELSVHPAVADLTVKEASLLRLYEQLGAGLAREAEQGP